MNQRGAKLSGKFTRVGMTILFSFLTFFILFPEHHIASAGRTLVIHNNTNATMFVINTTRWSRNATREQIRDYNGDFYKLADTRIPPMSKKSLFNFLDKNNNILYIYPKLVRPHRGYIYKAIYVTGTETAPREIYIVPKDFGMHAMFDAPGASE